MWATGARGKYSTFCTWYFVVYVVGMYMDRQLFVFESESNWRVSLFPLSCSLLVFVLSSLCLWFIIYIYIWLFFFFF
ncbi:hypothetical protein BDV28DRAFT_140331, partial [Aspergillus coremiiformis]